MGETELRNNKLEEEKEQKPLCSSHLYRNNEIRNILGYAVVMEALFQAQQLALAKKFEKKNEAHEFYGCSLCGEKCKCPKSRPQHLKSKGDTMHGREESQKQVWKDYTCWRCGKSLYHFKRSDAVKNEKVEEKENFLYTVDVDYEDEEKMEVFFDYTRGNRRRRNIGLATMQSRQSYVKMHALREMNRSGVEAMRTKIGTKNNSNRKLPKKIGFHH